MLDFRLTYGGVLQIKTNGDQRCYALKTKTGISCIDGDICEIIEEKEDYILLQELYTQLPFKLSRKEYMIAAVPAIPLTKKERTRHLAMLFADAITNGYDELDVYPDRYNRDWMQAYLIGHISRNKADAETRRMCEKARRARAMSARYSHDYDSSFGSGFGGGFSSGGGFSGGW